MCIVTMYQTRKVFFPHLNPHSVYGVNIEVITLLVTALGVVAFAVYCVVYVSLDNLQSTSAWTTCRVR